MQVLKKNALYLLIALVCYLSVNAYYFPRIASIGDEYDFLAQAQVFSHGTLSMEDAGFTSMPGMVAAKGKHYSWRNPGLPLIQSQLIKFGGQDLCQFYSILVHLLLFWLSILVLQKLSVSPYWALLILVHPTLVIYSRTMLADTSGALALLAAFYCLISKPRPFLIGLYLGIACLFRMQCIVVVPFFWLAMLLNQQTFRLSKESFSLTTWFTAGCLPGIGLLFGYYGYIFGSFTGKSDQYGFSASYLLNNLGHYGSALAIWWPFMTLVPFLAKDPLEKALRIIYTPFLVMLLFYFWYDQRPSFIVTSVIGQRLLIPVIPLMIIAYALTAERLAKAAQPQLPWLKTIQPYLKPAVLIASCTLAIILSRQHGLYLKDLENARTEVEELLPEGAVVIANPSFKELFFQRLPYENVFEFRHWYYGDTGGIASLETKGRPLYLGIYSKGKDSSLDEEVLTIYRRVSRLEEVGTSGPYLRLFKVVPF